MLAQGDYCQTIFSPILTASALRWKKTRLAAAPSTVIIIVGGGHGRHLCCRLISLSRSLQTILRINLDSTPFLILGIKKDRQLFAHCDQSAVSFSVLNCIIYDGKLVNTCLFFTHIMLAVHLPMQLLLHSRNSPRMLLYRQK